MIGKALRKSGRYGGLFIAAPAAVIVLVLPLAMVPVLFLRCTPVLGSLLVTLRPGRLLLMLPPPTLLRVLR